MRKSILILIIVTVLAIITVLVTMDILDIKNSANSNGSGTAGTTGTTGTADTEGDAAKSAAIDFTLSDLDGNQVSLSDFKGKNVFLNFWSSGCPPCRSEMPDMEKVYQEYKDKDLVVIAVNLGEDRDTVRSFVTAGKFSFIVLLDPEGVAGRNYVGRYIPVSHFIDKEGYVRKSITGAMSEDDMKSYVESLD